ncbi:Autophagy-related protein 27 [Verticillium dahliae VDG2]|nr:Autophagy-related protein 27 [Verticillium dahliae VDG2]
MAADASTIQLQLTERERQLRDLLVDVSKFININDQLPEPLVLRWAGGWVRDKLLGTTSHDIDVAINVMTGLRFGERLREYCDVPELASRHGIEPDDIGNLHRIAANPEKSKNLETTTVKVFGLDLDFVNLRTETYAEDSRNPTVDFGTAEEDALRRDATVNALFFNLHTEKVEDFTGGLGDMRDRLIRTPLEPLQTFMDDPLRVLRLVRFASRLGFAIDPAARDVMADPNVLAALRIKISRERVGVELEKMMKDHDPHRALQLIDELGLHHAIYTDTARADIPHPILSKWHIAYGLLRLLERSKAPGSIHDVLVRTDEDVYYSWMLASLVPYAHLNDPRADALTKGRPSLPVATTVAREGAKAPNKLCDVITAAHRNHSEILGLKKDVCAGREIGSQRDTLGMTIRKWEGRELHWKLQVLSTILLDAMDHLSDFDINNDESVLLLEAAYPAIIELARRYAKDPQSVPSAQRIRARLMREVCGGYIHASQFLPVTGVLSRHLGTLVHDSGFASSPYLKVGSVHTSPRRAILPDII